MLISLKVVFFVEIAKYEIISKKERQTVIVPVVLFQWEPSSCNQVVD